MTLLDTNVLLRFATAADPRFAAVDATITSLHSAGEALCVVPQNLYEFWAVATRPAAANGLGIPVPECQRQIIRLKRLFRLLPDLPGLYAEWEALVVAHNCVGRVSYDARLVAAMRTHGLTKLVTFNAADFVRFPDLNIVVPTALSSRATSPPETSP